MSLLEIIVLAVLIIGYGIWAESGGGGILDRSVIVIGRRKR